MLNDSPSKMEPVIRSREKQRVACKIKRRRRSRENQRGRRGAQILENFWTIFSNKYKGYVMRMQNAAVSTRETPPTFKMTSRGSNMKPLRCSELLEHMEVERSNSPSSWRSLIGVVSACVHAQGH